MHGRDWRRIAVLVSLACHSLERSTWYSLHRANISEQVATSTAWLGRKGAIHASHPSAAPQVPTRTTLQIRTHAQKYFLKLARNEGLDAAEGVFR